jgi:hypothetical protein
MTYRYVPQRLRLMAQLATLAGTALVGVSIMMTPVAVDPKLSQIERAMSADSWALVLVVAGTVGFLAELWSVFHKNDHRLFWLVSLCHIVLMATMIAYGASAMVGLIQRGLWYNFAPPVLAVLIAIWHYIYVKRRGREPVD